MKLLDRIAKGSATLTQREKALADYLIANYPHGALESATDIARKVGISASTVVRYFAKLGYPSFADVQREARTEISSKLSSPVQRVGITLGQDQSLQHVVDNAFLLDKENLNATREGLDMAEMEAFVRRLTRGNGRILVVGEKNSYPVAHYLHTHLNMCLPNVQMLDTRQSMLADSMMWVRQTDTLLAVTIRRYSRAVVQAARYFRHIGAPVLAVTDSPLSPIAALSDHRMLIRTASASPFDSYTAAFGLSNALISAVALSRKKEMGALLRRGDAIWKMFDTFIEQGPLNE
ncbi:MurR/RpiR family transcriptional regulator [Orrella sp. JC864]|uniref:MurR/RpiR family transcriptional regulator n=1 Tax=Orrella sp. JC864 TaxID=3120298 RepID=UPI0030084DF0